MTIRKEVFAYAAIAALAVFLRINRLGGVDVFEDGYTNYLISLNLYENGEYEDRISGMTLGNWLPMYHFVGAGAMFLFGGSRDVLLALSIALAAGTTVLAGLIGRRFGEGVGIAAALFWALNPLDILMSTMTLPDNLAIFSMAAASYLIVFKREKTIFLILGSLAMLAAVMTRYEAWVVVLFLGGYVIWEDRKTSLLRTSLSLIPAALFMIAWTVITYDGSLVVSQVVDQTSLQPKIISDKTGQSYPDLAVLFMFHYVQYYLIVIVLAFSAFFTWRSLKADMRFFVFAWILFWAVVWTMIVLGLMVGSYRYLAFASFALTVVAAFQLRELIGMFSERINRNRKRPIDPGGSLAYTMAVVVVAILIVPSMNHTFMKVDSLTVLNEPQERAGLWMKDHYEGGIVLFDSPIAAYYSDIPIGSIVSSRFLPNDREEALSYIEGNMSYVVFADHPYFRIVELFPELRNGTSWGSFKMVYTPNSWEVEFGALPTYVYEVDRDSYSEHVGDSFSIRHYRNDTKGGIPLHHDAEVDGGGRGVGYPILLYEEEFYLPGEPERRIENGTVRDVFRFVRTMNGTEVDPVGTVVVERKIDNGTLLVKTDYRYLPVGSELLMVNEFDPAILGRYVDFAGNDTTELNEWREVSATFNYLIDGDGHGVMVEKVEGSRIFIGSVPGSDLNDAVGLDHVVLVGEGGEHLFEYRIRPV